MPNLLVEQTKEIVTLSLNRPDKGNAFNAASIQALTAECRRIAMDTTIRVVILTGVGSHFCAGADLEWMRSMREESLEVNRADANALGELLFLMHTMPQVTIAAVNGSAFGGGVGLAAACDIAIASETALFCLSEVKLGLVPAVISPYIIQSIGMRQTRRYALTADVIDAVTAKHIGLVTEITSTEALLTEAHAIAKRITKNGPKALTATKSLFTEYHYPSLTPTQIAHTADLIAKVRVSEEGKAGIDAFLSKQSPPWTVKKDCHD